MIDLEAKICEILEVEQIDKKKPLKDMDEWDSLNALSIIAMLDSDYSIVISARELGDMSISEVFDIAN